MIKSDPVTLEMYIEDLVKEFPDAVGFLTRNGIRCIRCGEPVWKTLGKLLRDDGIENPQLLTVVDENEILIGGQSLADSAICILSKDDSYLQLYRDVLGPRLVSDAVK